MSERNHNLAKGVVLAGATTLVAVGAAMLGRGWKQDDLNRSLLTTPDWASDQLPEPDMLVDVLPGAAVSSSGLTNVQLPETDMDGAEQHFPILPVL